MKKITVEAKTVAKIYNRKAIFQNVSFRIEEGTALAITGKNGSGKSTLIKIVCGVLSSTKGSVHLSIDGNEILDREFYPHIGLVSPYLNMYEEFSAEENLSFIKKIRGLGSWAEEKGKSLLDQFGIYEHRKKEVRNYSSGMKQRLKYCAALLHEPPLLILDEPTSNLDEFGVESVRTIMKEQKTKGILLFGTNEKEDLSFADSIFNLDQLKNGK
ncbi:MAG: ABC transporter ATP-binding protein [Bacteroidota bacterium]|jgi:heme exporter protein A